MSTITPGCSCHFLKTKLVLPASFFWHLVVTLIYQAVFTSNRQQQGLLKGAFIKVGFKIISQTVLPAIVVNEFCGFHFPNGIAKTLFYKKRPDGNPPLVTPLR